MKVKHILIFVPLCFVLGFSLPVEEEEGDSGYVGISLQLLEARALTDSERNQPLSETGSPASSKPLSLDKDSVYAADYRYMVY